MNSWIDLPNLSSFTIGYGSFSKTVCLSLSSIFHSLFLSSTDVPFTNGQYTYGGGYAFRDIQETSIQCDSSLFLLFHFIHSLIISQTTNIISVEDWKGEYGVNVNC